MPKSIKSRDAATTEAPEAAPLTEAERFAAESVALVYEGPDQGIMVDGRTLRHHEIVRVWPHDAAAKVSTTLFREASEAEAAANQAACCPGCANGGQCLAPTNEGEG